MFNALFAVTNLLPHLVTLNEAIAAMGRMRIEIDRVSSIDPRGQSGLVGFPTDMSRENNPRAIGREIEVRNVTFEFPSRPGKKALNDVSLRIEKGKVTALVGRK
jgi:ATP-binding cassette subfamily B (MDR/TAP) protein 1